VQRALVAGATGYLGGHIVDELKRRGIWVRVLVRRPEQRTQFEGRVDEVFLGRVTEPSTLRGLADGVDTVFSTVGITRQKDGMTYDAVDYRGNLAILREATAARVESFLYVSVLHGRSLRETKLVAAKERFVDALQQSPIDSCVVRPSGFFSDMADLLGIAHRGLVPLIGDGQNCLNPISGHDLAGVCANAAAGACDADVEVGGPAVYTFDEIARLAFGVLGKSSRIWHVPPWTAGAALDVLRAVTSVKTYGPIEFFLTAATRENVAPCYGQERLEDFLLAEAERRGWLPRQPRDAS
jgi:uncharacterized protein YbjT (DUF2867 family)